MNILDLKECKTNQEVFQKIKERLLDIGLPAILEGLSSKFMYHEETIKKMFVAFTNNSNIILWGPGGFGKSVVVKAFCEFTGIPVITKVGHESTTVEELFGIPNMKMLLEESKYETAFENSVFSKRGLN